MPSWISSHALVWRYPYIAEPANTVARTSSEANSKFLCTKRSSVAAQIAPPRLLSPKMVSTIGGIRLLLHSTSGVLHLAGADLVNIREQPDKNKAPMSHTETNLAAGFDRFILLASS